MTRTERSFRLVGQSYRVLMQDKELMVLPLFSGVLTAAVMASFFFGFSLNPDVLSRRDPVMYLPLFLMYVVVYTVGIFFQAAIVAGATERMKGGDPTIGSALAAAGQRIGPIVLWAVVAATVGVILRAISERVGFVGKIITGLLGVAWSLATFFVVPVLVLERRPVGDSFKRSLSVFKDTWGETVVWSGGVGMVAYLAWITLVAIVVLLAWAGAGFAALLAGAIGAVTLVIFFSALHAVYVASLFRYATEGHVTNGFDDALFAEAFKEKR